jgi:hypothetical protein
MKKGATMLSLTCGIFPTGILQMKVCTWALISDVRREAAMNPNGR